MAALVSACGGATPPLTPPAMPAAPSAPDVASVTPATPSTAATPATTPAAPAADPRAAAKYDDPNEKAEPISMPALLSKSTPKSAFPKASVGDKECWEGLQVTGDHKKDYETIVAKCGTPTGLAEYAKPVSGKVHHIHDKRDDYTLKLAAGLCYRYFAVADNGIADLDVMVLKPGGALVADDQTTSPIAIVMPDKPWCMTEDAEYVFHVEVDGPGSGGYTLGVWARPQGKK